MQQPNQRGAIAVWTSLALVAFIVALGIGVDFSGQVAAATRAHAIAGQAARAAGQQLRVEQGAPVLDHTAAQRAASTYLRTAGLNGRTAIHADRVEVSVQGTYQCSFLTIIGITTLPVKATAAAEVTVAVDGRRRR